VPTPEENEVVIFRSFFKAGLRFPLSKFVVEVLKMWRNHPNYSSLSAHIAPLKAATHLNRNNPSVPRI
jgi:hypothetical protein